MAALLVGALALAASWQPGSCSPGKKAAFGVRARLLSGWASTPPAAQSLEWLRDIDAADAGAFLEGLATQAGVDSALPGEGRLQAASVKTYHELLVRNRYYSPRIETLRTVERRDRKLYGAGCPAGEAWALVWRAGSTAPAAACNAAALKAQLAAADEAAGELPDGFIASELDIALRAGVSQSVVCVYGALSAAGLPSLAPLLAEVRGLPRSFPWRVVFRHADGPAGGPAADTLTGYGFELAIKSSEYKTHADEEPAEGEVQQEEKEEQPVKDVLLETVGASDQLLTAGEIKDIGLQATARIKGSSAPLLALMRLSQDFPAQVASLVKTPVTDSLKRNATSMRHIVPESAEVFSVNGRLVRPDHSDLSLFPMMKTLQPFFVGLERMVRLGVSEKAACGLLQDAKAAKAPERLDWRSRYLPPPIYLVTKDKKTARWPTSLFQSMMFASGGLAPARMALYHMVFVFDPTEAADMVRAQDILSQMPLPASLHFVMVPRREAAAAMWDEDALGPRPAWLQKDASRPVEEERRRLSAVIAAAYGSLLEKKAVRARTFVKAMAKDASLDSATLDKVKAAWLSALAQEEVEGKEAQWEALVKGAESPGSMGANASQYANSLGVPVPCLLVNGQLLLKGAYEGQQAFFPTIAYEQQLFQQALFQRRMSEETKPVDFVASKGLVEAYHEDITPNLAQRGGEENMQRESSPDAEYLQWPAEALMAMPFLESAEEEPLQEGLGLYHVTVLRSLDHAYLLQTFASHLLEPERASLRENALISVPPLTSHWTVLVEAAQGDAALKELAACVRGTLAAEAPRLQRLELLKFLGAALPAARASDPGLPAQRVRELCELGLQKSGIKAGIEGAQASAAEEALLAAAAAAGGKGKRRALLWVCNGRVVALEASSQQVFPRHVQALEVMEAQYDVTPQGAEEEEEEEEDGWEPEPGGKAKAKKEKVQALPAKLAGEALQAKALGLVAAIRSEALRESRGDRGHGLANNRIFENAPEAFRLHIPPPQPEAACPIRAYGILDPLSPTAQSASAVLALFGMAFNAEVTLVFNPKLRNSEYPLSRYYREVIRWPERLADDRAVADLAGGQVGGDDAAFSLATEHVLTAAVHALPTWLVTAHEAEHDMDNLRSVDVGDGKVCETTYLLRQLYVEGQAFVLGEDGWPIASAKGLQLDMVSKGEEGQTIDDTIVMGNLGYFQVHGNPGIYEVALKQGLSSETFESANLRELEVSSYITPPYQVRVKLRPGRSHEDLFGEDKVSAKKAKGGLLDRLKSFFGGGEKVQEVQVKHVDESLATIHIFSVASGHLYEKLLGIMILSVRNQTKNPLHFHFIDNFLSPKFKEFIPQLASRYNFAFSFVTYKWPSWLNPQSEKQRLIWAYKVLFLDVLFPMDVPKVIFIDADQVVRADVRELWDMDLKGRVYGFVPMGDTNPDTEGFRFWKQGYWKNHLGNLPYHISALYVVDLVEFRRTSIGDQLRGIYNQLSRDPNSLSNLEQDLINFAQTQVPILSLPAEWLWCETWCSQESKAKAKTLDLCQNPLTKEPKIVMAKRIIAEWQTYHDEVQRFQDQLYLPGSTAEAGAKGKPEL